MTRTLNKPNFWSSPAFLNKLAQGTILLIFISILAKGFFFSPEYLFYRYDDDFYYYIGIAEHLSQNMHSTFNGEHLSNGYHPLWMVVLTLMLKIAPYESVVFHLILTVIIITSFAVTIKLLDSIFQYFDIPYWIRILNLAVFFFVARLLYFGGMEVILTIPLGLYLMDYYLKRDRHDYLFMGFIASLMILSRLDSIFLVLFILIQIVINYRFEIKELIRPMLLFGAGGILLPLYLASNLYFFESLLPLSGMAKQMRIEGGFAFRPFIDWATSHHPHKLILFFVWIGEIGIFSYLISRYKRLDTVSQRALPFLGFAIIFFFVHGFLSDWHWWPWYLYPVLIAMPLLIIVSWHNFLKDWPIFERIGKSTMSMLALAPVILLLLYAIYQVRTPTRVANNFAEAKEVADTLNIYEDAYVGIGDAAGIVKMLLKDGHKPIQLEGLVMDKPYLEYLEKQPSSEEVFDTYNIRFYIMLRPKKENSCFYSFFPKQAGEKSVRISTQFCSDPVFEGKNFVVFDLQNEQASKNI